jgi:hypothetical protein
MTQDCSCHGSGGKHSQTVPSTLERPRYSPGLILEDSDLTSAVDYTRNLTRMLFSNLFGCGVICGLGVSVSTDCGLEVRIAPGLALDGCGDPVQVPRPLTISLDKNELERLQHKSFWVVLCGKEKYCAPRSLVCDSDDFDGLTHATRIRALAEVSLAFEKPECVCECQPGVPVKPPVKAQAAAQSQAGVALPVDSNGRDRPQSDEIDCHHDHETRVECVADCGCGSACSCGCCILLARIEFGTDAQGRDGWIAVNRGVRRFIRPKLLADPIDREPGWAGIRSEPSEVYWGEIDDGSRRAAVSRLFPKKQAGDLLYGQDVEQIIEYARNRATHPEPGKLSVKVEEAEADNVVVSSREVPVDNPPVKKPK